METQKPPLSVRNGPSCIPRPSPKPMSHLPQPGSLRKRPILELSSAEGKENDGQEPSTKRPKLSSTTTTTNQVKKPPLKSTTTRKPMARAPVTTSTAKKKAVVSSRSNPVKPQRGAVAKVVTKKPAVGGATTKAAGGGVAKGNGKQKRAAWDVKGRLQDVESLYSQLQCQLKDLDSLKVEQEGTIKVKQEESTVALQRVESLEEELVALRAKHKCKTERLSFLEREHTSLQSSHASLGLDLAATRSALSQITTDVSTLQCRYDASKIAKNEAVEESARKSELIASLEASKQQHLCTIAEYEARIREDESTRRRLHNTIQELKGNIRVFCRVRPFLPGETHGHDKESGRGSSGSRGSKGEAKGVDSKLDIQFPDRDNKRIALEFTTDQATVTGGVTAAKSYNFEFDRVFGPSSPQETVFIEISQLVQSALDGYNVCIFAYGQTGSGKTYTMEGPENKPLPLGEPEPEAEVDSRGMIPRAVEQVFESALSLREQGWQYKLEASFLEIYNETIRDLLSPSPSSSHNNPPLQHVHEIKLDPSQPGGVYITNVTPIPVTSQAHVAGLLERAARNRAVATTNCNERSSRSHSLFRLQLTGTNGVTGEQCKGTLNLVDLAGSERLAQSGSVGERLKETKNINKSLSNLGQVIMAIANKENHVPYRNSKLTYLLQNSLGGNSKTLMFVNMSPQPSSFQETVCSLRFATKVNQCNIGTARKATK